MFAPSGSSYVRDPAPGETRRRFWQLRCAGLDGYLFDTGTRAKRWMAQGFVVDANHAKPGTYAIGQVTVAQCAICRGWHADVNAETPGFIVKPIPCRDC